MLNESQVQKFDQDGFLILKNFLSPEECQRLKDECENIIESNHFLDDIEKISIFRGDEKQRSADMYFLTSTDKIRPFLEEKAKQVLAENTNENSGSKSKKVFNKIGHALHALNPVFRQVTFDQKVQEVFKSLNFRKPVVCQSMYIFKQPFIGGEVKPHQDGTYLHTDPLKVAGVWIALEDCTLGNGCLQFVPGSHRTCPLSSRLIRNPNKEEFDQGKYLIYTNEPVFTHRDDEYVSAEVKRGDAIVIDGLVVHRSAANTSPNSRQIYTFHVYESDGAKFSEDNWMEPSPISFLPLYSC